MLRNKPVSPSTSIVGVIEIHAPGDQVYASYRQMVPQIEAENPTEKVAGSLPILISLMVMECLFRQRPLRNQNGFVFACAHSAVRCHLLQKNQ